MALALAQLEATVRHDLDAVSNRGAWCAMRDAMRRICKHGGLVVGGACRDFVHRMHHAREFYDTTLDADLIHYGDPQRQPSSRGRLQLPRDVDAVIRAESLSGLIDDLERIFVEVQRVFVRDPSSYIPEWPSRSSSRIRWHRYKITWSPGDAASLSRALRYLDPVMLETTKFRLGCFFCLDLMVVSTRHGETLKSYLPFGPGVDLECNSLIMLSDAGREFRFETLLDPVDYRGIGDGCMLLQRVFLDICNKRAILTDASRATSNHALIIKRITSLTRRGWSVGGFRTLRVDDLPGTCAACGRIGARYTMKCCGAKCHGACLLKSESAKRVSTNDGDACGSIDEGVSGDATGSATCDLAGDLAGGMDWVDVEAGAETGLDAGAAAGAETEAEAGVERGPCDVPETLVDCTVPDDNSMAHCRFCEHTLKTFNEFHIAKALEDMTHRD
jgi:hypothetical protein